MKYYIVLWGVCLMVTVGMFAAEKSWWLALLPVAIALAVTFGPWLMMRLYEKSGE